MGFFNPIFNLHTPKTTNFAEKRRLEFNCELNGPLTTYKCQVDG